MGDQLSAVNAVAAVMGDLRAMPKANQGHGYAYRGIDDVMNALSPLLAKHGVVIVPRVVNAETVAALGRKDGWTASRVWYEFEVFGPDGSSFVGGAYADGLSNQGTGPGVAASYAYKTFALQLFCIPTDSGLDAERTPPPPETVGRAGAKRFADVFARIEDEEARALVVGEWKAIWGDKPTQVLAEDADAAEVDAESLVNLRLGSGQ